MPSPELLFQPGMQQEQLSGHPALHDLDYVGYMELGLCINKQVHMIRHHLIARIVKAYSYAISYRIRLQSSSTPSFKTALRYFVHHTMWYC